jgi:DNA-binding beta-propeller fold protein YncE
VEHHQEHGAPEHQADLGTDLIRSTRIGNYLTAAAFAAAVLCSGTISSAVAAPVLRECVTSGSVLGGCSALSGGSGSLAGASSLAVSPDGRNVYVGAYGADSLLWFRRGSSGALSFGGCFANEGAAGCSDPAADSLGGAGGVAVSPGGGDVYVTSDLGRSVTRYSRSARTGELTFGSCTSDAGAHGCTEARRATLAGANAVAVGPGGEDVYVTAGDSGTITHFTRAADGSLEFDDCVAGTKGLGCDATEGNSLAGVNAIVVAPRGRDVYATSFAGRAIVRFVRRPDGSLRYRGCVADDGAGDCTEPRVDALDGASGVAISSDGKRVYVASQVGAVTAFDRTPSRGALRWSGCVRSDGPGGCTNPRRASLAGATGVVAVRGGRVYVTSQRGNSLTELSDRRGRLSFVSCLAARRANGCGSAPATALEGVYGLTVRGDDLYTAAPLTGALGTFRLP